MIGVTVGASEGWWDNLISLNGRSVYALGSVNGVGGGGMM